MSLTWIKSSRCDSGNCVEVARKGPWVLMRDSKDPDGPTLEFSPPEWVEFLGALRALGGHPHNVAEAADGSVAVFAPSRRDEVLAVSALDWASFVAGANAGDFELGRVTA